MARLVLSSEQNFARISFTNRGFAKMVSSVRSLSQTTPNRDSVVEIAKVLKDIKVIPQEPPGFESLPEFEGIDYVGYIVDKERLDKKTQEWIRIDEYRLIGSSANFFYDTRVAYGYQYRYRMRSVMKTTKKIEVESSEDLDVQDDVRKLESDIIQEQLKTQQNIIASVETVTNVGLLQQSSTGRVSTTFDLLEGVTVQADESKTTIGRTRTNPVSFSTAQVLRTINNLKVADAIFTTGETIAAVVLEKVLNEIKSEKPKQFKYISRYYVSEATPWHYVDVTENVPPPPPSSIKISPSTPNEHILISWLAPGNSQRDIKAFRLYKRNRVNQAWIHLGQFKKNENFYIDRAVRFNESYIYAITSVDFHGIESVLSMQIQAELNPRLKADGAERPLKWISGSGAKIRSGFGEVFKKFLDLEVPIVAEKNVVLGPTVALAGDNKKYLLRVKSLDTHEIKEFTVTLNNRKVSSPNSG